MRKIFYFLLFLGPLAFSQEIKWAVSFDTLAIQVGERVTANYRYNGLDKPEWYGVSPTDSLLEIVSASAVASPEKGIWEQTIQLTAFDTGYFVIPPGIITLQGDSMFTEPGLLHVVDTPLNSEAFNDIKAPIEAPFNWMGWMLIALLVLGLVAGLIWVFKKVFAKPEAKEVVISKEKKYWEVALAQLQKLDREKESWSGDLKYLYSEMSFVLRSYVSQQFNLDVMETPTSEMNPVLKRLPWFSRDVDLLKSLLSGADMVKFAKFEPTAQKAQNDLSDAIKLIVNTHPKPQEL